MMRATGIARPYSMRDCMACWRIELLSTRASDVNPAMAIPTWSSISISFFWYVASSPVERFSVNSTACVLDRSPMAADPCLTASSAYSTWCSLPWGDWG